MESSFLPIFILAFVAASAAAQPHVVVTASQPQKETSRSYLKRREDFGRKAYT